MFQKQIKNTFSKKKNYTYTFFFFAELTNLSSTNRKIQRPRSLSGQYFLFEILHLEPVFVVDVISRRVILLDDLERVVLLCGRNKLNKLTTQVVVVVVCTHSPSAWSADTTRQPHLLQSL